MLISKELLSKVLNRNILKIKIFSNCVGYFYDEKYDEINIFELAHKCKEWALNKNYEIWSVSKNKRGEAQIEHFKNGTMAVRYGKTEPESIFQVRMDTKPN